MSEQDNATPEQEETTLGSGYIKIETGSQKHPEAKESEDGRVVATIEVYVGESLKDAVEKYGEDFVMENYKRSVIVACQGKVRRELDQGVPVATVEDNLNDLDPTEKQSTIQDPQVQAMKAFQRMSPEEQAQYLKLIQGQA